MEKNLKFALSPFTFRFTPGLLDCDSGPGFLSVPDTICFWNCISHVKHKFRCSAKLNFLPKKYNFKVFLTLWRQTMHMLHHGMPGSIPDKSDICINQLGPSLHTDLILIQGYAAEKCCANRYCTNLTQNSPSKKCISLGLGGWQLHPIPLVEIWIRMVYLYCIYCIYTVRLESRCALGLQ